MRSWLPRIFFLVAVLTAVSSTQAVPRVEFSAEDEAIIQQKWPEARETPAGLRYVVLKEGEGNRPRTRQRLSVLYRGTFIDGTEFSAMQDPNTPFIFRLGANEVIEGWEQAFADMRAGEKRVLIIPYSLGYGLRGNPPNVPSRTTLVFEVELLKIE
jgi:FKBP-type peptidyl-prolyl cis-trans isomerase